MTPAQEKIEAMSDNDVALFLVEKIVGRVFDDENERQTWAAMRAWRPEYNLNEAMEVVEKAGLERHIQEKSWAESWVGSFALAWDGEEWEAGWKTSGPEGEDWYEPWMGYSKRHARAVCNAVIAAHEVRCARPATSSF